MNIPFPAPTLIFKKTPENVARLISALQQGKSVSMACRVAGIHPTTAYNWKRNDPAFAESWEMAIEEGIDALEDEALRRAVGGVERPVFKDGELVGHTTQYSDQLLMFLLKGRRPTRYRDRMAIGGDEEAPPVRIENAPAREILAGRILQLTARRGEAEGSGGADGGGS